MRKPIVAILTLILCLCVCVHTALAEEVRVTVTATPAELGESGNVKFTFAISNFSDYELSDIVIVYNGTSYEDLRATIIPPSQSIPSFELELPVAESQLGSPITFTVNCVRNGEPITAETTATIARSSDPTVTLTREASATMVRQGAKVKLTYSLKNETKFDMTDITVIDEEVSNSPLKQDTLRAGGSFSWDWELTMGKDDVRSAPIVTYTVNGKTKSFSGVEAVTLTAVLVQLEMKVDAGLPTASGVNFTLEVKNTGNQEITGIGVTDERGNAVSDASTSLKAGESATYSYAVVPVMTESVRNVKFILKGTDAQGQPYQLESAESYPVYPLVDDTQLDVTMTSETVTPWTSDSGKIVARVKIVNRSLVALTNVTVLETGNVLNTYEMLQSGETSFDTEIILGSPRNLQFTLKGMDPTGTQRELAVCALPVAYGTETAEQTPSQQIETNGNMRAFSFLSSTISKILLSLGVLMVLAFIVLIVLSIAERRRGIQLDDDLFLDPEEDEEDEIDSFFRETDKKPKSFYDDREETLNYTKRMRENTRRSTSDRLTAIALPPSSLPQDDAAPVEMEYDTPRHERGAQATYQPVKPQQHAAYDETPYEPPFAEPARRQPAAEPAYAPPVEPAYQRPVEPAYVPPVEPAYAPPVEPVYHQPAVDTAYAAPAAEQTYWQASERPAYPEEFYEAEYDGEPPLPYRTEEPRGEAQYQPMQTPRSVVTRPQPAVQPRRQREIRHVHGRPKP